MLLIPVDAIGPEIEIEWRLRPAFWGRGYATEAASAVLWHGFVDLALDELVADINAANIASIAVAERIGLRRRGSKMAAEQTLVRYALTRVEAEETARPS